jgi:hypothetical protein
MENEESEQQIDEQPTDEQPTDEQPADEQPTDEQQSDEQPTDEQQSDEQQSDEQPTEQSIETDNNTNDNAIAISDVEICNNEKANTKHKSKKQFSEECNHCSKTFKSKPTYDKHISLQLCYLPDEITYCKVCSITLQNHNQYKKHLFTMEHLNNIGYNKIDRLQTKEISQVHLADPYLNSNDINKIATTNLGDSFTFVFNVGNTKTVSLVNNIQDKQKNQVSNTQNTLNNTTLPILEITNNNINNINNDNDNTIQSNTSIQQIPIEPTIRQQKIISVLEKHINDKITPGDSGKMFYKFLDNKLQIEDYKSLNTIIGNLHIPSNYKETYLKVVEIFISMLVKEKSKGEKLYKDKDISEIVINLTS